MRLSRKMTMTGAKSNLFQRPCQHSLQRLCNHLQRQRAVCQLSQSLQQQLLPCIIRRQLLQSPLPPAWQRWAPGKQPWVPWYNANTCMHARVERAPSKLHMHACRSLGWTPQWPLLS